MAMINGLDNLPASGDVVEGFERTADDRVVYLKFSSGKTVMAHFDTVDFSPAGEMCCNGQCGQEPSA